MPKPNVPSWGAYNPHAEHYKIVWPVGVPAVTTAAWGDADWLRYAEGFRPNGYEGGQTDKVAYDEWIARNKLGDWDALMLEVDEYGYEVVKDEGDVPLSLWKKGGGSGIGFSYLTSFYSWIEHQRELVKGLVNLKKLDIEIRELGYAFAADPRHGAPFVIAPKVTPVMINRAQELRFDDIRDLIRWRDACQHEQTEGVEALIRFGRHPEDFNHRNPITGKRTNE